AFEAGYLPGGPLQSPVVPTRSQDANEEQRRDCDCPTRPNRAYRDDRFSGQCRWRIVQPSNNITPQRVRCSLQTHLTGEVHRHPYAVVLAPARFTDLEMLLYTA